MKGAFISLASSRCIFTQGAPQGRPEQTIFTSLIYFFALLVKLRIFLADWKALETNPVTQSPAHSRHSIKLC